MGAVRKQHWGNRTIIHSSYATESVSGNEQVGGLVGGDTSLHSNIHNSYAAGVVVGNVQVGILVGHHESGDMASNYAAEALDGGSAVALVGSGDGSTGRNFSRTLAQLQCPLAPGEACQGASSYSGWSTRTWYFGNEQTLPVHRALRPLPPAAPVRLQARWNSEAELESRWNNPETGSLNAGY